MKRAYLDAELLLFQMAAANEFYTEWDKENYPDVYHYVCRIDEAKVQFWEKINELRELLTGYDFILAFGDKRSFRYRVWPQYKSNRRKQKHAFSLILAKQKRCGASFTPSFAPSPHP